ncbi:hypothetical protein [Vibrio proteolyticus]
MKKLLTLLTLSAAVAASPVMAQGETQDTKANLQQAIAQSQQISQRVGEIQQELATIKQKAYEQDPELVNATEKANATLEKKAKEVGYDPQGFEQALQSARTKLADKGVTESERQSILTKLKAQQQQQADKRTQFLANPDVQQVNQQLQKKLVAAMNKVDPDTSKLLKELDGLIKSMKS